MNLLLYTGNTGGNMTHLETIGDFYIENLQKTEENRNKEDWT